MDAEEARFAEDTAAADERRKTRGLVATTLIWAAGIALQLLAPLLRDRVPLSDDLFITSMIGPVWLFLQVCLLAGVLRVIQGVSRRWRTSARAAVAVTAAAALALLEPDMLTYVFGGGVPLRQDPVRAALLWSVPLAFYLVPASIVGIAWVQLERRITTARALGFGLVFIGLANFPFILWLTHLWDVYIRTSGGEAVIARVARALACAVM